MQQNFSNATKAVLSVLGSNPIMKVDSYKLSHPFVYDDGITGMFSYVEARIKNETIVPFGTQMWAIKNLLTPITKENIDEAEAFATAHGEPFPRCMLVSRFDERENRPGTSHSQEAMMFSDGTRIPSGTTRIFTGK
jgi:hypothetical protein